MEQERQDIPTTSQRWATITLALSMLLASLGTSIANIALPTIAAGFSAPFHEVQAVVVAYLAGLTVTVVIAGRVGDRRGLKPALIGGLITFIAGSLLCAIAPSLWLLVGARVIQGIGAAFLMTLSMALMRRTADERRVGEAMGLLGTVSAFGTALGPSLGGLLIPLTGWPGIFWVQILPAIAALVLTVRCLAGESARAKPSAPKPAVPFPLRLARSLAVNVMVAAVMMTTLVIGPFYLSLGLGLEAASVGLIMAAGPVISIITGVPSGRLVDAWGSQRVLAIGLGLLAAGAFLLAHLPAATGAIGYLASIVVLTPGYQLFQAANNTVALSDAPAESRGTVAGALNLSRNIGLIAGASVMGAVFAAGAGSATVADATVEGVAQGMRVTFHAAGTMMLIAIGTALAGRRIGEPPSSARSPSDGLRRTGGRGLD